MIDVSAFTTRGDGTPRNIDEYPDVYAAYKRVVLEDGATAEDIGLLCLWLVYVAECPSIQWSPLTRLVFIGFRNELPSIDALAGMWGALSLQGVEPFRRSGSKYRP